MAWEVGGETYKVYYKGEVVLEKEEPLTAADIRAAAKSVGIQGKFDVLDAETFVELDPADMPYEGNVIIKPKYNAA